MTLEKGIDLDGSPISLEIDLPLVNPDWTLECSRIIANVFGPNRDAMNGHALSVIATDETERTERDKENLASFRALNSWAKAMALARDTAISSGKPPKWPEAPDGSEKVVSEWV